MPELPEVETVRSGLDPLLCGRQVVKVVCRIEKLRLPLDPLLSENLSGKTIQAVTRRAKYLLIHLESGTLLLHLGMSGVLRVVEPHTPPGKHDHIDLLLDDGRILRFNDPRRFGLVLFLKTDPYRHRLLKDLGPEPLDKTLADDHLFIRSRKRRLAIKSFIMDQKVLVGVGNIYASEALFAAGIDPRRSAASLNRSEAHRLLQSIQGILVTAIAAGGTTLKDFRQSDGRPGYFSRQLQVYGRKGKPCPNCCGLITHIVQGQRSSFFCPKCQR